ncbi:MAG: type II secretion system protein [Candidatus Brocadiae bacterium]|nr:type II secretion system protein [Candidatus Brocadiia bacterium]
MKIKKGFTLIEMVVVLSVMAIVAGTLVPVGMQVIERERERVTMENMGTIANAVRDYYRDVGQWPPVSTGNQRNLAALYTNPGVTGWRGPYVASNFVSTDAADNTILYDKWRMLYRAIPDTTSPNLILRIQSAGPDKAYHATMQGDDIVRQVYVGDLTISTTNSLKGITTIAEINAINTALNYYRARNYAPAITTATTWQNALRQLQTRSLLPGTNGTGTYFSDEWGTTYTFDGATVSSSNLR